MGVVAGAPEGHTADEAVQTPPPPEQTQQAAEAEQARKAPGFGERGRMRRRARFLRRARELAYRDLGGLVFDLHRFGQRNDPLVMAKLAMLRQIDTEVRELEQALGERQSVTVLREVGIAACPRCAAIHDSDDRFCPGCGLAFDANADRPISTAPMAAPPQTAPAQTAPAQTPPAQTPPAQTPPAAAPTAAQPTSPTPAPGALPAAGATASPHQAPSPVRPTATPAPAKPASFAPSQPASASPSPSTAPTRDEHKQASEDEPTQILRPRAPDK
jgi:hypothetical protein